MSNFVKIGRDATIEEALGQEAKKKRLRFEAGDMPDFSDDELSKLNANSRLAYQIAREELAAKEEESDNDDEFEMLSRIVGSVQTGEASARLEVKGKQEGMAYKFLRPDLVPQYTAATRGWKIVKDGPERTLANPSGKGPHVIGDKGHPELILVKRPESYEKAELTAKKERLEADRQSVDDMYKSRVESVTGMKAIDDSYRGRFKDIGSDEDDDE